jgi:hypothetical protein
MNRPYKPPSLPCLRAALVLLAVALCWQMADAAPAPFERPPIRPKQLYRQDMVGNWTMTWAGQPCTVTLSATGDYTCDWYGINFVGSWRLDPQGQFWITESSRPEDPDLWRSYSVRLDPVTLSGRVEVGQPDVEVRFQRLRSSGKQP